MEEKVKLRSEVEKEYQWDIDQMLSMDDFEKVSDEIRNLGSQIKDMKGHIMDSSSSLYQYLTLSEMLDRKLELLYIYSHMLCDTDTTDFVLQQFKMKSESLMEEMNEVLSFTRPEMLQCHYETVLQYEKEKEELQAYHFFFESFYRYQEHTLTEKEESVIALASNAFGTGDSVFYNIDNADIHLGMISDENGSLVELTNSNYNYYMTSRNREVRKEAFHTMYAYFKGVKNTLAASLKGQIKENFFFSKVRKYKNPLEMSLFHDHIDVRVYENLIEVVHENLDSMYEYMRVRKEVLGIDEMHMYDVYVDLVKEEPKKISFLEGKRIVKEALRPLGEQYLQDLEKAFLERWIDIYPNKGKKSGAYSWGCYDSNPYLLLNYNETLDSVSTMAHELGHSMHSYYSDLNQPYIYHQYPIFLAEIASTVNEVLLNQYWYQHARTKEEKIMYLTEFLDKVRTTIYRQTMFAEFEKIMHEKEGKGIPLTEEEFSSTYYQLNQLYYGKDMVSDDDIRYEWARIPHFYSSFYVYKYATGLSCAIAIAFSILEGNEEVRNQYLNFLSSGGKDYPLSILKEVGIDMTSKEPIEKALHVFKHKLQELKDLCNVQ